jgi:hypothetical protein
MAMLLFTALHLRGVAGLDDREPVVPRLPPPSDYGISPRRSSIENDRATAEALFQGSLSNEAAAVSVTIRTVRQKINTISTFRSHRTLILITRVYSMQFYTCKSRLKL